MELAYDIAGCALRWRFVGASRLHGTLSRRPWETDGGVMLASVVRDGDMDRSLQGVAQIVRAYDAAGSVQLSVMTDVPTDLPGLLQRVGGVATDVTGRRRLEALGRAFHRPRVWILGLDHSPFAVADVLEQTLEDVRKVVPPDRALYPPLFVLGHRLQGRRGTDLSIGFPIDSPFGSVSTPAQRLWMVYLHWRIAWFTGGRPGWAEQVAPRLCSGLRMGDDATFEQRLTEVAQETWRDQTTERHRKVEHWLRRWPNPDPASTRELGELDLLWHPAHDPERGHQPAPWVARALLARGTSPPARSLLRACDACEPLAVAALSRCLQLEAVLKARVGALTLVTDTDVERVNANLVTQRDVVRDLALVPGTAAARATCLFDCAGLNDVLRLVRDTHLRGLGIRLRDVRNALAHGHPPSWATTSSVADVWRMLVG